MIIAAGIFAVSGTGHGVRWWSGRSSRRVDRSATTVPNARTPPCCRHRGARNSHWREPVRSCPAASCATRCRCSSPSGSTDPERDEADRLRADIQRQLIALGPPTSLRRARITCRHEWTSPMKCPKCGYLGYEQVERCRNCGYEFSLGSAAPTPDLRLRDNSSVPQPLDDLDSWTRRRRPAPAADRFNDVRAETPTRRTAARNVMAELPLFGPPITDDVPLITKASPPRPPLSVRRATPEVPRLRAEARAPLLDWPDPAADASASGRAAGFGTTGCAVAGRRVRAGIDATHTEPAGIGSRAHRCRHRRGAARRGRPRSSFTSR